MNIWLTEWKDMSDYARKLGSMFGRREDVWAGYVDVEFNSEPPFISAIPGTDSQAYCRNDNSFAKEGFGVTFHEVTTKTCKSHEEAEINLAYKIEDYINSVKPNLDTSKCCLAWRVRPEIIRCLKLSEYGTSMIEKYKGYARLVVLCPGYMREA